MWGCDQHLSPVFVLLIWEASLNPITHGGGEVESTRTVFTARVDPLEVKFDPDTF